MLRVISPEESAAAARKAIVEGCRLIAEGEAMVLGAVGALTMFESNFRFGHYEERKTTVRAFTTEQIDALANSLRKEAEMQQGEGTGCSQKEAE